MFSLFTFLFLLVVPFHADAAAVPTVPCTYPNACWPSASVWSYLNTTLGGNLIRAVPSAAPCHVPYLNDAACQVARTNWTRTFWRADQPGGYHDIAWENGDSFCNIDNPPEVPCAQGLVPIYIARVKTVEHVKSAVRFARDYKISTRVKGGSHDYLGRSSGNGTFGIQTIDLKGISFDTNFRPTGAPYSAAKEYVVHVAAGEQAYFVNKAVAARGRMIVTGTSYSIGAAGGWILGGGHSSLSPQYGLGVDNVLQFELISPDGNCRTANKYTNPDLFWALRGGGPGFGVITKVTYRTFPPVSSVSLNYVTAQYAAESLPGLLKIFLGLQPTLAEKNFTGYATTSPTSFWSQLLIHNSADIAITNATLQPLWNYAASENAAGRPFSLQVNSSTVPTFFSLFPKDPATLSEDGGQVALLGSRLLPITAFQGDKLDAVTAQLTKLPIFMCFVAGGKVSQVATDATAIHPSWRSATHHMIYTSGYLTNTPVSGRDFQRRTLTSTTQELGAMFPTAGSYINEADANEPNWQEVFWGSNYARLLRIKKVYDPLNIFTCRHCVGDTS